MGLFKKTDTLHAYRHRFGKPYISPPVWWLIGLCSLVFMAYGIVGLASPEMAAVLRRNLMMPTGYAQYSAKPWTLLTSVFFHDSLLLFLGDMIGILLFGNLTSMLFSKKVVAPLFVAGGLIASASVWVFKEIPLTRELLVDTYIGGSSGGMMTLAVLASFYMPEQMIRLYGVYPLKLKFIGRALLLFSIVCIFFKYDSGANLLHLGGAFGGYLFLVLLKRHTSATPLPFFRTRKKVWKSAKVEMKIIHNKPVSDDEFGDIRVSRKEYLDHLLDKIGRHGVDSLSRSELDFLNHFGKED